MKPLPDSHSKGRPIAMIGDTGRPEIAGKFHVDGIGYNYFSQEQECKIKLPIEDNVYIETPPNPPPDRHDRDMSRNIPLNIFTWSAVILFIVIEIWAVIKFLL